MIKVCVKILKKSFCQIFLWKSLWKSLSKIFFKIFVKFSVKLFVATFASWQNFQLLDTKRDLKFQHQGYKRLFDDKSNKNYVVEISKDEYGDESSHQKYQIPSYSCFDCLLSTKIRLPRLHSAHNLLKVWTIKYCANKQGDKFWCPKQNQNTFRVLNFLWASESLCCFLLLNITV